MSLHSAIEAAPAAEAARRTKRTRVLMTGVLLTADGSHKVTIRDISRTGAQIAGAKNIPRDCDAIFRRGTLFAAARVAWVTGDEAGVTFYRELSPDEIDGCLPAALLNAR
jgi:hypothetical protein